MITAALYPYVPEDVQVVSRKTQPPGSRISIRIGLAKERRFAGRPNGSPEMGRWIIFEGVRFFCSIETLHRDHEDCERDDLSLPPEYLFAGMKGPSRCKMAAAGVVRGSQGRPKI